MFSIFKYPPRSRLIPELYLVLVAQVAYYTPSTMMSCMVGTPGVGISLSVRCDSGTSPGSL